MNVVALGKVEYAVTKAYQNDIHGSMTQDEKKLKCVVLWIHIIWSQTYGITIMIWQTL